MFVGLEEVLARLKDRGPLSTSAIAREFGLNALDARILLLDAHLHGLVIRNDWEEWALSSRGREALLGSENDLLAARGAAYDRRSRIARELSSSWHRGPRRRAALVGVCVAACGLIAAVPIGLDSFAAGTAQPAAQTQVAALPAGQRHVLGRTVRHSHTVAVSERYFERDVRAERELRTQTRSASRYTAPTLAFRARASSGTGNVAPASQSLEMATNRSFRNKGREGCSGSDRTVLTSRHAAAGRHASRTSCASSTGSTRSSDSSAQ
jgi:hypothetical protein